MRKTKKILSILLSLLMLVSLMPSAFAGSVLPTVFDWSETTPGVVEFETVSGVTDYTLKLTKTGEDGVRTLYVRDCTEATDVIDARAVMLQKGAGEYTAKFVIEENGEVVEETNAITYQYDYNGSLTALPKATELTYSDGEFSWSADTAEVADWNVKLYAVLGVYKKEWIIDLGNSRANAQTSYAAGADWLFREFDAFFERENQDIDKNYYSLYAAVQAIPKDITTHTFSPESDMIPIARAAESGSVLPTEFKWSETVPGVVEFKAVPGVEKYLHRLIRTHKTDIGGGMGGGISDAMVYFDGNGNGTVDLRWEMLSDGPDYYTFDFVATDDGTFRGNVTEYSLPLEYTYTPSASQQALPKLTGLKYENNVLSWSAIDDEVLAYDVSFYAVCGDEVHGLGGTIMHPKSKISSIENDGDWWFEHFFDSFFERDQQAGLDKSKYSLYATISAFPGDIINYAQGPESEMILIPRGAGGGSVVTPPAPAKHKVTYNVLDKVYEEFEVECGAEIPVPEAHPSVEGYLFKEWEGIPEDGIMPDKDLVINAKMTLLTTIKGKVLYNDAPAQGAMVVIPNMATAVTTDENGEFAVADYPCGSFVINVEYNGMKTTVNVDATTAETDLGEIIVKELGTSTVITAPAVQAVTITDVEALLTEQEKADLETSGDTVVIETKAEEKQDTDTQIDEFAGTNYSGYTASGVFIDLTLAKVWGSDPTNPVAITEANDLIAFDIEIPQAIQGKSEYIILREHGTAVDVITKTPNADGEYLEVSGNVLTLYAKKFSVYSMYAKDAAPVYVGGGGGITSLSNFTITFNYGAGSQIQTAKVKRNATVDEPAEPTKEGFIFGGWYTDKECTKEYDFETKVTKSFTLYAKWIEEEAELETKTIVLTIGEVAATIDGEAVTNDVAPIIVNERTMLPIRFIAEELGATVDWNPETKTVTITLDEINIVIVIDEAVATVNDEEITLDSPAFIENDRTYLPLRFVMEELGADVQWDGEARTVTIVK